MARLDQALDKLESYARDMRIFSPGAKLLLCVSGGADSMALLLLFTRLLSRIRLTLLVVHVNHQLRGPSSHADEDLVREQCQELGVPLIVRKIRVAQGAGLENRARQQRFEVFEEILSAYRFDLIVTGHHLNDQSETMLLNLARGAGLSGLAGIRPLAGNVAHPLLCFEKQELIQILEEEKMPWREDASNEDQSLKRNWVRHSLIPLLETELNPRLGSSLGLQARIFAEAEEMLLKRAQQLMKKVALEQEPERITLSLPEFERCSRLERWYILREFTSQLSGSERDFFSYNFQELMNLLDSQGSKYVPLGRGLRAVKVYDRLILEPDEEPEPVPEELSIGEDRSRAVWGDYRFSFKLLKVLPAQPEEDPLRVFLDADKISFPLQIRARRPGDRFQPLGMDGQVKLKNFFINVKLPRFERDRVPIFDDGDKIVWVTGLRVDARAALDPDSSRFLLISAENMKARPKRAASRVEARRMK
ncbi:MAG: tRNA lysidine(34) synthetase TilS [Candidatus Cloacimonetes bacterium]|jgi:tRNA(Ile)-lysidine synthase|nr:tRNA lysidine(34) synthetase TilS [Candidatus Cloacimonadota bacterium]MDX9949104.1 tRNA lysidine(34) synthetase TilS [Candidatus Syntrophosphaera sp.]NLN84846.1 tRNA lysidine(34) synthetase TilS [Candidatus Cloacimonadota bacterium]